MKDRAWDIAGALTGIVFVVLMFVSMAVAGDPDLEPGDPSAKIATVLAIRSDKVETASMIGLVGLAFFFGFLGYFRRRLQQAEGEGGWLAEVAYGGGLVTAAMLLVLLSMQLATTSVSGHQDTQVAKVFVRVRMELRYGVRAPDDRLHVGCVFDHCPVCCSAALDRMARVPGGVVIANALDWNGAGHGLGCCSSASSS